MPTNVQELKQSISPEEKAQMRQLEGLISLKSILAEDRENILEYLDEILEERQEFFQELNVNAEELAEAREGIVRAYDAVIEAVEMSKFKAVKMAA